MNPFQLSTAPAWAQRFRSDDLDEVREFVRNRVSGDHSRVAHRRGRIGFELAWIRGADAALGWAEVAVPKTIRGTVAEPTLHLMVPAGSEYRIGRRSAVAGPGTATFLAPGWEFTRYSPPGEVFALSVDGRSLAEAIETRRPGARTGLLFRTQSFELRAPEMAKFQVAVEECVLASGPMVLSPNACAGQRLIALVADLLLQHEAAPRASDFARARMADLELWIDSHLAEPLTIDRLCLVAGVGERSLQKSFESRRGISPMRFVTERRLAEARRRLQAGGIGADVTHVALGLGFHHMGRFAKLYREAFGETPSQSRVRRARQV